ncbi:hypothetical protein ACHHYP_08542 [Achlya hypogyna]|uniref:Rab-GAP TBC domain-containing protein n=1 Tax=Achlya hypogyna TaxID=1202772 RepID=A0A1V9YPI1_ACHHY|nr:hypothetical protein ACHHYP_08542 [Achlya hypogyna]
MQRRLECAASVHSWEAVDLHVEEAKAMGRQLVCDLERLLQRIADSIMERTSARSVKEVLLTTLPPCFLGVFAYLTTADVGRCHCVAAAWHAVLACDGVLSRSITTPAARWRYWRHFAPLHELDYTLFLQPSVHDELIGKEVARTTFYPKELLYPESKPHGYLYRLGSSVSPSPLLLELQAKLTAVFQAAACFNPHTGYGHGMSFTGAALLTCLGYDEVATFTAWCLLLEHRCMAGLWEGAAFGAGLDYRLHQLTHCMLTYLPAMSKMLAVHGVATPMFASSWVLSLFLHERSLPPAVLAHVLDAFVQEGWPAMFAIYVGLLVVHEEEVLQSSSDLLQTLLSLPRRLGDHGLGRYRLVAYTMLTPPLASLLAAYEADMAPPP